MPRRLIIPEFRRFISRKGYRRYALARARSRPLLLIAARNDKVGRLIFKNCPPLTNISGRAGQHPPWLHRSRCPEKYTSRLCRPIRVQCRDRTVDRAVRVSWLKIKRVENKKKSCEKNTIAPLCGTWFWWRAYISAPMVAIVVPMPIMAAGSCSVCCRVR